MGNIVIGYKNLCLESGVTFTPSSEHASHDADNLGKAHPSQFWRLTTLTGTPNVAVAGMPKTEKVELVAPICVSASPHQNMIEDSQDMTSGDWATNDLATVTEASASNPITRFYGIRGYKLDSNSGSVTPYIQQTYTKAAATVELTSSIYVDITSVTAGANLRLIMLDGASYARADIDMSDGSINSTAASGFSGVSATSTVQTGGTGSTFRIVLTGTTASGTSLISRAHLLDSAYATTYTDAGEAIAAVGGMQTELNGSASTLVSTDSTHGRAAHWLVSTSLTNSDYKNLALRENLIPWFDTRGWIHGYHIFTGIAFRYVGAATVYFYDPHNSAGQLDVSNIYIGPIYQPAQNFTAGRPIGFDPVTGGRIFQWTLDFQTEADAYTEYMAMALKVGVGSNESTIAAGGQEYRYGKTPILVIENPDDTTHGQERMVYGFVDNLQIIGKAWNTTKAANVHRVELTVAEVMK